MATSGNYRKKPKKTDPSYSKKKALDFLPVTRKFPLASAIGEPQTDTVLIDCGRIASERNRRLYRQGKMYRAKLDIDAIGLEGVAMEVWAIRNDWAAIRAWELAKSVHDKSTEAEREALGGRVARWSDFRVDPGLVGTRFTSYLDGTPGGGVNLVDYGEFNLSQVIADNNTTIRTFTWNVTGGASQFSILQEFQDGHQVTNSPAVTDGALGYSGVDQDYSQTDGIALQDYGNEPPYRNEITTSAWTKVGTLGYSGGSGRMSTGYFDAPCGLIVVTITGGTSAALSTNLMLELQAGDYKGIQAHNMERF